MSLLQVSSNTNRQHNRDEDLDATETESLYKSPSKGKGKERASFLPGTSCGDNRQVGEIAHNAGSVSACSRCVAPDQLIASKPRDRLHTIVALSPIACQG